VLAFGRGRTALITSAILRRCEILLRRLPGRLHRGKTGRSTDIVGIAAECPHDGEYRFENTTRLIGMVTICEAAYSQSALLRNAAGCRADHRVLLLREGGRFRPSVVVTRACGCPVSAVSVITGCPSFAGQMTEYRSIKRPRPMALRSTSSRMPARSLPAASRVKRGRILPSSRPPQQRLQTRFRLRAGFFSVPLSGA